MVNYPGRTLGLLVICMSALWVSSEAEPGPKEIPLKGGLYQIHGAPETSAYELRLFLTYPGWEISVAPRKEILDSAIPKKDIPSKYINETRQGLLKIMEPSLLPQSLDELDWRGLPKYSLDWNFIVTQYTNPTVKADVLICGRVEYLGITVTSDVLFPDAVSALTDEKIVKMAAKVLRIPAEKMPKFTVEGRTTDTIANVIVSRENLICEWDEHKGSYKDREWWSLFALLYVKGKLTIMISTRDFKNVGIPARIEGDSWVLKRPEPVKAKQ